MQRYLIVVEDVSLATTPGIPFDGGLKLRQYFPKEEGMMQHSDGRYFPQ